MRRMFQLFTKMLCNWLPLLVSLTLGLSSQCLAKAGERANDKYVFIDKSGKIVFPLPKDAECDQFSDQMLKFRAAYATSYMNKEGKTIAQAFKRGHPFSEGLAAVGDFGKIGFIDKTGEFAIPQVFEDALPFREGLAPVEVNKGFGFIDHSGKIVIPPFFDNVSGFSEGMAAVESQGLIGFIDKNGAWLIKPRFRYVDGFSDGLALIRDSDSEYYIDHDGHTVITVDDEQRKRPFDYWHVSETGLTSGPSFSSGFNSRIYADTFTFSEGLSPMSKDKKFGYINKSGQFVIPAQFSNAHPFVDGLARVCLDRKYGFVDKSGKLVIEPKFLKASDFSEGVAAVAIGHNQWGYINKKGELVLKAKYMFAEPFHDGLAKVQLAGYHDDMIK